MRPVPPSVWFIVPSMTPMWRPGVGRDQAAQVTMHGHAFRQLPTASTCDHAACPSCKLTHTCIITPSACCLLLYLHAKSLPLGLSWGVCRRAVQNLTLQPLPYPTNSLEPVRPCVLSCLCTEQRTPGMSGISVVEAACTYSETETVCLGQHPDSVAGTLTLPCAAQYIDNATMALHHGVHNKAYITNANAALAEAPPAAKNLTLLGLNHNVGTGLFSKPALNTAFRCVLLVLPQLMEVCTTYQVTAVTAYSLPEKGERWLKRAMHVDTGQAASCMPS